VGVVVDGRCRMYRHRAVVSKTVVTQIEKITR